MLLSVHQMRGCRPLQSEWEHKPALQSFLEGCSADLIVHLFSAEMEGGGFGLESS